MAFDNVSQARKVFSPVHTRTGISCNAPRRILFCKPVFEREKTQPQLGFYFLHGSSITELQFQELEISN